MTRPACMTEAEWADWQAPILGRVPTGHPCYDCPAAFHREQRVAGTCDGYPLHGGVRRLTYAPSIAQERRRAQWRAYGRRRRAVA